MRQTFTPSGTKTGDKFAGSLVAEYKLPGNVDSEVTLNTSGVVEGEFKGSPMKDVMVTFNCERPEPSKAGFLSSAKCTVDYKNEILTNKTSYEAYSGDLASTSSIPSSNPLPMRFLARPTIG